MNNCALAVHLGTPMLNLSILQLRNQAIIDSTFCPKISANHNYLFIKHRYKTNILHILKEMLCIVFALHFAQNVDSNHIKLKN